MYVFLARPDQTYTPRPVLYGLLRPLLGVRRLVYVLQRTYVVDLIILADSMRDNGIAVPGKGPSMGLEAEREGEDKVMTEDG